MANNPYRIALADLYRVVRFFLIPYLVILVACLGIKIMYTREQIYFAVNGVYSGWGDLIFPLFTDLGDGLAGIALALIMALYSYRRAFIFITGYALSALVGQLFKFIFNQPRPYVYFEKQHAKMHLVSGIQMLTNHSFPSGHTITSFTACLTLAYFVRNKYFDILMLLLACCIGYSRMYLSEHFFEDVAAGSAIGVFVTLFWLQWLDSRAFIHEGKWRGGLLKKVE